MPLCNASPYVDASIASIVCQTVSDFELVVLENGSTDDSRERARAWAARDERIRVIENDARLGLIRSSNEAVAATRAAIVARMDADDVSQPERLARQLAVLAVRPDAVAVGTLYDGIDRRGRRVRPRDRSLLARRSTEAPFPHGSVVFRRTAFDAIGGYRDDALGWEDLDLLQRLAQVGRVLVLPDPLYRLRYHAASSSTKRDARFVRRYADAKRATIARRFDAQPPASVYSDDSDAGRLYLRESMRLWAGERPALVRMLRYDDIRQAPVRRLLLVAWGIWGRISPRTLRTALRIWIRARDARHARALPDGRPVEWRFG
jgi:glycosyltransferase involved in cell wall biosynthesis